MNATEFERELNKLTEDLAEKYIKLRDLELAGYKDEKLMDMLFYGHVARVEARRIQEEFFPMAENSEEIVMTLLYEEVDYSNEVDDTSVQYAKVGLFLYVEYELYKQIDAIEESIGDEVELRLF